MRPQVAPCAGHRCQDFFSLFGDFRHYLEFVLLDDMVDPQCVESRWYLPFDDFTGRRCRRPLMRTRPTGKQRCDSVATETGESQSGRPRISPDATSKSLRRQ